jgi:fluoride ion exporter CrcB/FEX
MLRMAPDWATLSLALHISVGSMLGVLTRLLLGRAFDTSGLGIVTSTSPLFVDLPANAFGSFLAGAYAPFKANTLRTIPDIHHGLSTGYLGSVTSTPTCFYIILALSLQCKELSSAISFFV